VGNTLIETIFKEGNEFNYIRHNEITPGRMTMLFLHGLGESGQCFQEVFEDGRFDKCNIIVPDLIGYGKSSESADGDYRFEVHVEKLWKIIAGLEINSIIVIGHSMGGDIATFLCASDRKNMIQKFVNIEGNVTQYDLFISREAVKAAEEGNFTHWFYDELMKSKILEDWGQKYLSCRRYHSSLRDCRPEAFLANAWELFSKNTELPGKYKSETGRIYCSLSIPKVFCYGTESISSGSVDFLEESKLKRQVFDGAFHWLMLDRAKEFYSFLFDFIYT
jgi:pimeloyl-ACP methyl ester carboxylesterase